jgi:hypothetical protein
MFSPPTSIDLDNIICAPSGCVIPAERMTTLREGIHSSE